MGSRAPTAMRGQGAGCSLSRGAGCPRSPPSSGTSAELCPPGVSRSRPRTVHPLGSWVGQREEWGTGRWGRWVQGSQYPRTRREGPDTPLPTGSSSCGPRCGQVSGGSARGWPQTVAEEQVRMLGPGSLPVPPRRTLTCSSSPCASLRVSAQMRSSAPNTTRPGSSLASSALPRAWSLRMVDSGITRGWGWLE